MKHSIFMLLSLLLFSNIQGQHIDAEWTFTDYHNDPAHFGIEEYNLSLEDNFSFITIGYANIFLIYQDLPNKTYLKKELICFNENVTAYDIFDFDGDGDGEIFVVHTDGKVSMIDYEKETILEEIGYVEERVNGALKVCDLESDGIIEFICGPLLGAGSGSLSIYNISNQLLVKKKSYPIFDVNEIYVIDVNKDSILDIVQSPSGFNGTNVIDGKTLENISENHFIEGSVLVTDYDNNGIYELISTSDGMVNIYDVISLQLIKSFEIDNDFLGARILGNANGKIIFANNYFSGLYLRQFNLLTGDFDWEKSIDHIFGWDIKNLALMDSDGDNDLEIVFSTTTAYSGVLSIIEYESLETEFTSKDFYLEVDHAVLKYNNFTNEIWFLTSELGIEEDLTTVTKLDPANLDIENTSIKSQNLNEYLGSIQIGITELQINNEVRPAISLITRESIKFYDNITGDSIYPDLTFSSGINGFKIYEDLSTQESQIVVIYSIGEVVIHTQVDGEFQIQSTFEISDYSDFPSTFSVISLIDSNERILLLANKNVLSLINIENQNLESVLKLNRGIADLVTWISPDSLGHFAFVHDRTQIKKIDLVNLVVVDSLVLPSTYIDSNIAIGSFHGDSDEVVVVDGCEIYFIDPQSFSLQSTEKLISFVSTELTTISSQNYPNDKLLVETRSGFYLYSFAEVSNYVQDLNGPKSLCYFPNPSSDFLRLDNECFNCNYLIINQIGQVIKEGTLNSNQIDIRFLTAGLYFIKTLDNKIEYTNQFVKVN